MRLLASLCVLALSLTPFQSQAAWDIYQSYVIVDSGEGNEYLAGGINAASSSSFHGTDLGDFTSSDALILNGGELLTYKNGNSNVCGGNLQYRVYLSGDAAGSFSAVNLGYNSELGGGDQKWDETGAAIDLLNGLSPGDYFLEVYWDASGSDNDPGGCGDARYDSDSGNNFTASFSILIDGSANTLIGEFQPNPTGSDPSTVSVELIGGVPGESFDLWLLSIESDGADGRVDRASNVTGSYDAEGRAVVSIDDLENPSHSVVLTTSFSGAEGVDLDPDNDLTVDMSILGTVLDAVGISDSGADDDNLYGEVLGGTDIDYNGTSEPFLVFRDATSGAWYALVETEGSVEAYDAAGDPVDLCGFSVTFSDSFESFGAQNPSWMSANCNGCTDPAYEEFNPSATEDDGSCNTLADPCADALVLGSIEVDLSTTTLTSEDGSATLTVATGTPTSLTLTGLNGAGDYSFVQPGAIDGIAAGYYEVTAIDADGCNSDTLKLVMPYSLCCDCGVSDIDTDGICDDVDNCTDRTAANYDDPSNADCSNAGCMDPAYTEYNASATTDDGSCSTLASTCVPPTMDGHSYGVVEIGSQCWFSENLQTTVYADGSEIPEVTDDGDWSGLSTDARCTYDNDASPPEGYGKLYNWYAVDDERRLCPTGWHVPTDDEWTALETYLGANGHSGSEGAALKSTSGWTNSGNGTDDFGFSALPGGAREAMNGNFINAGISGGWWSSTPTSSGGYRRSMHYLNPSLSKVGNHAIFGFSVRCLRDAD